MGEGLGVLLRGLGLGGVGGGGGGGGRHTATHFRIADSQTCQGYLLLAIQWPSIPLKLPLDSREVIETVSSGEKKCLFCHNAIH